MNTYWPIIQKLLLGGFVLIVPIVCGVWIIRQRARATRNPEIEADCARAGFAVATSRVHGGPIVRGTLHGTPFTLTASPGAKGTPPMTVINVPSAFGSSFAVSRDSSRDLSGADLLEPVFPDATARDAVRALFLLGFDTVSGGNGSLRAVRTFKAGVLDPGSLGAVVKQLTLLRSTFGTQASSTAAGSERSTLWLIGVSAALLVLGFFPFDAGIRLTEPFADSADVLMDAGPIILVTYLALSALALFVLRGRPAARVEAAIIIFLGLPGLALGGWGAAMLANQNLDESLARERHTQVEGGGYSKKKRSPTVVLAPWRPGGASVDFPVSGATHKNLIAGDRWIMRTRAGWLGYEWVESVRPAPDAVYARQVVPRSAWMTSAQYQQEFSAMTRRGLYPHEVEGRCEAGNVQYRAEWITTPRGVTFIAFTGMAREDYERRENEHGARGYRLESLRQFTDCQHIERLSATWLRNRSGG